MRIEHDTSLHAQFVDMRHRTVQMHGCFEMEGNYVGACFAERLEISFGSGNHEMHVYQLVCGFSHSFHNRDTKRNVGDKNPIHYVNMNPFGKALVYHIYFPAKVQEIGCEKRGGNDWHVVFSLVSAFSETFGGDKNQPSVKALKITIISGSHKKSSPKAAQISLSQIGFQYFAPCGMLQPADGFFFYLPHALAGKVKFLANFLQGVRIGSVEAKV